ncbi:MAG: adenosylcobinamide-phosphate synthase CbiB [Bacteroidaceae bacterium]|nr:cobalamin biosynthesis protein CobD [Bacteroidaceae bacterium]MDD6015014.1 adenosylcobinamide-phosphate synthase CbiB [Prevotellaceae bacterium]MDD7526957.1 adenosylcobinamide-phosphate synthase CbiB [Prevotellaceae bacterium]MDY5759340.1 adenosylcobinamide-phosphate synthase CbiB [Bacteroidaceae bacterium]
MTVQTYILPLLIGWFLDFLLGDPQWMPHPVVWFGKMISFGEKHLNKGKQRKLKGALLSLFFVTFVFVVTWALLYMASLLAGNFDFSLFTLHFSLSTLLSSLIIFYCLAGTTLIREVRQTFLAVDRSLKEGRKQVARIVGRDTSELSAQEIRTAALETLAENLSDGVIAPLFWLAIGGVPAMLTYKMVNTLDSMIGYRTDRYRDFGCLAARLDDVANYIPARLTAFLMVLASGRFTLLKFVAQYGPRHASPNSGYPEAALAGILGCRFGGPHTYFGQLFDKPYIGENDRLLTTDDMHTAIRINRTSECIAILLLILIFAFFHYFIFQI